VAPGPRSGNRVIEPGVLQTTSTVRDAVVETWTVGRRIYEPVYATPVAGAVLECEALDPAVATITATGATTFAAEGTARFRIRRGILERVIPQRFVPTPGGTEDRITAFATGSLARHLFDDVHGRTTANQNNAATVEFSVANDSLGSFTRNAGAWFSGIADKLTCASVWNSIGGGQRGATAITPRHVLCARHFPLSNGARARWVTAGNETVERTIIGSAEPPLAFPPNAFGTSLYPDLWVGTLDSALPNTITPAQLPAWDLAARLPINESQQRAFGAPLLVRNQARRWSVAGFFDNSVFTNAFGQQTRELVFAQPAFLSANRLSLWTEPVPGDSGQPVVAMVNGNAVLLTVLTSVDRGTDIASHLSDIATAITAADANAGVNTGLTPTLANLSSFPSYT
jgi:hypothetical protein